MKPSLVALLGVCLVAPATAGAEGFKASQNCNAIVAAASETEQLLLGAWVMGYLDGVNAGASLVRTDNAAVVMRNVAAACAANPDMTLLDIVQGNKKDTPETGGTKANAEAFLRQFLDPAADRIALTAGLRPTEEDIRAVYAPELAEKLIPAYAAMFTPGVQIGPKEGQTEVLVWRGTTDSLKRGDPVLEDFPGGYADVRPYLQGDFPIVRFKFVAPGETSGLAFDGLIHINGRWVLMPKPWRVLG